MVLPASHGISRVPWYSGTHDAVSAFAYAAVTLCGSTFQWSSAGLYRIICCEPTTPVVRRRPVWPCSLSLAATWEIAVAFFSSAYLDVSVQRVPSLLAMDSPAGTVLLQTVSCLIRKSADQCLLAAPRSLSQLDASFIGA